MRIAVISDIHGNGVALRNALVSIAEKGIDQLICLGDLCYGGPEPHASIELVMRHADYCVLGNTDSALLGYIKNNGIPIEDKLLKWTADALSAEDIAFLSSLPMTAELKTAGNAVISAFHSTPDSNSAELTAEKMKTLAGTSDRRTIYVSGHTHQPSVFHIGLSSFLNPGSIGRTTVRLSDGTKKHLPQAKYCIISINREITMEHVQETFELDEYKKTLLGSDMPDKERLIKRWGIDLR